MSLRDKQKIAELQRQIEDLKAARALRIEATTPPRPADDLAPEARPPSPLAPEALAPDGKATVQVRSVRPRTADSRTCLKFIEAAKVPCSVHLFQLLKDDPQLDHGLAALVGAYKHHWSVPPGPAEDIANALHIQDRGFCQRLLRTGSPLISKSGTKDPRGRVVYALNLVLLGEEIRPPTEKVRPWLDDSGKLLIEQPAPSPTEHPPLAPSLYDQQLARVAALEANSARFLALLDSRATALGAALDAPIPPSAVDAALALLDATSALDAALPASSERSVLRENLDQLRRSLTTRN